MSIINESYADREIERKTQREMQIVIRTVKNRERERDTKRHGSNIRGSQTVGSDIRSCQVVI